MCKKTEKPLLDLMIKAKEAMSSPITFCRFVEEIEKIVVKLFYMPREEKEAYQRVWWDIQELHLRLYPVWQDIGEPQDWTGLEQYQQQAIQNIQKLNIFFIEYYLKLLQHIIDRANSSVGNKKQFECFINDMYRIEERLDFLSEDEQDDLSCLQSNMEISYCYIDEDSKNPLWKDGWCADKHKAKNEYQEFVNFIQNLKKNMEVRKKIFFLN